MKFDASMLTIPVAPVEAAGANGQA
jgi:hypothetical protein